MENHLTKQALESEHEGERETAARPPPTQPETPPHDHAAAAAAVSSSSPSAAARPPPMQPEPPSSPPSPTSSSSSSIIAHHEENTQLLMIQEEVSTLNPIWERPKNIEYVGEDMSFTIDFSHMLSPDQMKELQNKFSKTDSLCMMGDNWDLENNQDEKEKEINIEEKLVEPKQKEEIWGEGLNFNWNAVLNNMSISDDDSIDEFLDNKNNDKDIVQLSEEDVYEKPVFYAEKCNDPGYFTLPFSIGDSRKIFCLIDTGASFNIMSLDLYEELGLTNLKPTNISLCLADQKSCKPAGKIEDVILAIEDFRFPLDFMVLNTPMDPIHPIVLGRPFLASGEVEINAFDGTITLHIGEHTRIFNMTWLAGGMKYSEEPLNELEEALNNIHRLEE